MSITLTDILNDFVDIHGYNEFNLIEMLMRRDNIIDMIIVSNPDEIHKFIFDTLYNFYSSIHKNVYNNIHLTNRYKPKYKIKKYCKSVFRGFYKSYNSSTIYNIKLFNSNFIYSKIVYIINYENYNRLNMMCKYNNFNNKCIEMFNNIKLNNILYNKIHYKELNKFSYLSLFLCKFDYAQEQAKLNQIYKKMIHNDNNKITKILNEIFPYCITKIIMVYYKFI